MPSMIKCRVVGSGLLRYGHAIIRLQIVKVSQMNTLFSGYLHRLKLHPSCRKASM